jgi:sugar O-acyltransferase (sialic acid O-acetyltransferase NeuD family)
MTKVVIFGSEKLAELTHFYFTHDSPYEVVAFTVNESYIRNKEFQGLPLVAFEEVEKLYPPDKYKMFIAIGYTRLNTLRAEKYAEAKKKGYELVSYVCTRSVYWGDTEVGDNCFILENQTIQPTVKIGNDVVIWSGNHFGHNVVIGDHCWLSSHIVVCGGVNIGEYSFIGVNATIRDGVSIGRENIVGAGSLILNHTKDKSVYIGKATDLYPLDSTRFERMMDISSPMGR